MPDQPRQEKQHTTDKQELEHRKFLDRLDNDPEFLEQRRSRHRIGPDDIEILDE